MISYEQKEFVENAVKLLKHDTRIEGIALGGSFITGIMDEFSDLDFVIAVTPHAFQQVMNSRVRIVERLGNLLSAFTGEHVGEPRLLICLYDEPLLHVDFKFVSLDEIEKRMEDPVILYERDRCLSCAYLQREAKIPEPDIQWIEDRFWVWVHYCAGKIGRGEIFEAMDAISFLRRTVIGPLILVKNGKLPRGVRKIEQDAPDDMPALLETVAIHDGQSCIKALRKMIELYLDLRSSYITKKLKFRYEAERRALEHFESIA